ncbi:MAG: flagellar protein FlaG [Nitrosomonadales bacterium]|nr:flagellar protein FlaG [Nitrosomonadales bacterium]
MLIQNTSNMAQAPQPARFTSDGEPGAVVTARSNVEVKPGVVFEQAAAKQVAEQQPSATQLQNVVGNINKVMKQSNKNLEFTVDTDTKKSIVKLVDSETGDVIRQFPSEEALAISRAIENIQKGLLLKQKA